MSLSHGSNLIYSSLLQSSSRPLLSNSLVFSIFFFMHAPWCNLSSRGSCLALQQPYALSTAKIWWENNRHCLWKYWKFGTPEQQAASLNAVRDTILGIFLIVVVGPFVQFGLS
ncbi:uncharacterized protein LOC116138081 isoform X3 [Pistacia vera]|uniref:uncharacterized protein LOC116138081 isoform X3 n=1 Tax=Pistacia vera TaxID=55513 RepID=UPI0012631545|nr:uncharacterized protein LOC116138081 isoform X3 [Pistacia vera]